MYIYTHIHTYIYTHTYICIPIFQFLCTAQPSAAWHGGSASMRIRDALSRHGPPPEAQFSMISPEKKQVLFRILPVDPFTLEMIFQEQCSGELVYRFSSHFGIMSLHMSHFRELQNMIKQDGKQKHVSVQVVLSENGLVAFQKV